MSYSLLLSVRQWQKDSFGTHSTAGRVVGCGWHVHFWQHRLLTHCWHHKVPGVCWLWARTPGLARQHLQEELCGPGPSEARLAPLQRLPSADTLTPTSITITAFPRVVNDLPAICITITKAWQKVVHTGGFWIAQLRILEAGKYSGWVSRSYPASVADLSKVFFMINWIKMC